MITGLETDQILDALPYGVVIRDAAGHLIYHNAQAERTLGLDENEMFDHDVMDSRWRAVHEDGSPFPGEAHPSMIALRTGQPVQGVTMGIAKPDGGIAWLDIDANPVHDPATGETTAVIMTFADVTARLQAKLEAEAAWQQSARILDTISDGCFTLDREWRFTSINTQAEAIVRRLRSELLGQKLIDAFPAMEGTSFHHAYQRAMERGVPASAVDYYPRLDAWIEARAFPTGDGLIVCFRDISEFRRLADDLRQSEAQHRLLLDAIPDRMFLLDRDGRFLNVRVQPATPTVTPSGELLGMTVSDVLPPEAAACIREAIGKALDERRLQTIEYRIPIGEKVYDFEARVVASGANEAMAIVRDVTASKETERALTESEARFRTLVEQVPAVIYTKGLAEPSTLDYVSPFVETVLGYTAEEIAADPTIWNRSLHPDDAARILTIEGEADQPGEPRTAEYRLIARDGRTVWVQDTAELVVDDDGNSLWWQGVVNDITARKEANERIRQSEARLAEAQRLAQMGNWERSLSTGSLFWSDELFRVYGVSPETFTPSFEGFLEIVHPEDRACLRKTIERALATQTSYDCEFRAVLPDGSVRVIHSIGRVTVDAEGQPVVLSGTAQNITERKRAEEALAASLGRLAAVLTQIAEGVMITDASGVVSFLNDAARRLIGVETVDVPVEDFSMVYRAYTMEGDPVSPNQLPHARALSKDDVASTRICFRRLDGTEVITDVTATPVIAADGTRIGAVMTLVDVTEKIELEQYKEDFFRNVSHDLRTPIAEIKTAIGVVLANVPPETPAPLQRLLCHIDEGTDRITRLVESILELTRLQAGPARHSMQEIDLQELVIRASRSIETLAAASEQHLEVAVPPEPVWIEADPERIWSVLLNLLSNAVNYGRSGGAIRLGLECEADEVILTVADDGIGIPSADLNRIFDRFYRGGNGRRALPSSGLGLTIAQAAIEQHGGSIRVESREGEGSTFTVTLPASGPRARATIQEIA